MKLKNPVTSEEVALTEYRFLLKTATSFPAKVLLSLRVQIPLGMNLFSLF